MLQYDARLCSIAYCVRTRKLHIDSAPFHTSTKVTQLINNVETICTNILESGDRARAMKRLRVPPLEEKQSPVVTFRVGIFVGK
ncbi:unnamed protein product, partial [Didymodactylos carnosus]